MSRGAHLTALQFDRILSLWDHGRGLSWVAIAARLGLSYDIVRKVTRGERARPCGKRRASHCRKVKSARLSNLGLANRITPPAFQEDVQMTPEIVRTHFIDELMPAHYSRPRAAADKFFADLTAHLSRAGFGPTVLKRAAEILQGEGSGTFPKIPVCLAACREAREQLADEAAAANGAAPASNEGRDSEPVTAPESWPRQHETGSRPGLGNGESVAMAPMKSARAA